MKKIIAVAAALVLALTATISLTGIVASTKGANTAVLTNLAGEGSGEGSGIDLNGITDKLGGGSFELPDLGGIGDMLGGFDLGGIGDMLGGFDLGGIGDMLGGFDLGGIGDMLGGSGELGGIGDLIGGSSSSEETPTVPDEPIVNPSTGDVL